MTANIIKKDVKKEMNKFVEQLKSNSMISVLLTSETVKSDEFEIMIFSDENEDDENNESNDNWIVDENIA